MSPATRVLALVVLSACNGQIDALPTPDDTERPPPGPTGPGVVIEDPSVWPPSYGCEASELADAPLRRLTNAQYSQVLTQIFPGLELPTLDLPAPQYGQLRTYELEYNTLARSNNDFFVTLAQLMGLRDVETFGVRAANFGPMTELMA